LRSWPRSRASCCNQAKGYCILCPLSRSPLAVVVAGIGLLFPIPFSGSGFVQDRPSSGCTLRDWNGFAPVPFAVAEAIDDRPPSFTYYEERTEICV
jgi:hypothetical protein